MPSQWSKPRSATSTGSNILEVTGFVASSPDFAQQPKVIDGASRIFHDVFGEAGRHARSAMGVAALPHGAAVEIELSVAVAR